jgi:hypothetical protein
MARGRNAQPSAGINDSQSVRTMGVGGERGNDGAKESMGCKRNLLVDTYGLVPTVKVHLVAVMERDGVALIWPSARIKAASSHLVHVWLDAA